MRVVADTSILAALIFHEPEADGLVDRLDAKTLCAPEILKYELANVALKKARRDPHLTPEILGRLADFLETADIKWHDVNPTDVAILARVTGLSAYDASYLWLAGSLEADLVTQDKRLAAVVGMETEERE